MRLLRSNKFEPKCRHPPKYGLISSSPVGIAMLAISMEYVEIARDDNILALPLFDKNRQVGD